MNRYSDTEIKRVRAAHPLETYLPARGFELKRIGQELACRCMFHEDNTPSFSVNPAKQLWTCRAGCGGGDILAFVQKLDGIGFSEAVEKLGGRADESPSQNNGASHEPRHENRQIASAGAPLPATKPKIVATYSYTDSAGKEIFQAVRLEPKSFRQRRKGEDGRWIWNLDGVEPMLYRLQDVSESEFIWIVEGEKDADSIAAFGLCATCNPMGAGKWRDWHTEAMRGKIVVLCGDNDEPGEKHMDAVERAIAPVTKSTRRLRIPAPHKDVSDYLASATTPEAGMKELLDIAESAPELFNGVDLPLQSMAELETDYRAFVKASDKRSLHFSLWLPRLGALRPVLPGELVFILANTGAGKCLGKGTPVIMADGSVKAVEDVKIGDLLMGPDSKPRTVQGTAVGKEEMFRVNQRNGNSFTCNRSHILSLKSTGYWCHSGNRLTKKWRGGELLNLSVGDYIGKSARFKHLWKAWKTGIDFSNAELPVPPYIFGIWLGDGHTGKAAFTTGDNEIVTELENYAVTQGLSIRREEGHGCANIYLVRQAAPKTIAGSRCIGKDCDRVATVRNRCHACYERARYHGEFDSAKNPLVDALKQTGAWKQKHIPATYLRSSREQRLELLAGLLDTDGYCPQRSQAVYTTVLKELADNVLFLARSLGFMCSLREKKTSLKSRGYKGIAYNVTICGDVLKIPTRLARRRPEGTVQRQSQLNAFTVESIGEGEYYGFELDGDGLFLLGDFTVTHNTAALQNIAASIPHLPTLLFELELPGTLTFERFAALASGEDAKDVWRAYKEENTVSWRESRKLDHVHVCSKSGIKVSDIEKIVTLSHLKTGKPPAVVMVDYIGLVHGEGRSKYERTSAIAQELKVLAKRTNTVVICSSQVSRDKDDPFAEITLFSGKDSGEIENSSGVLLGLWCDKENPERRYLRVLKSTKGGGGLLVHLDFIGAAMQMRQSADQPDAQNHAPKLKPFKPKSTQNIPFPYQEETPP